MFKPKFPIIWNEAIEKLSSDDNVDWDKVNNTSLVKIRLYYEEMIRSTEDLERVYEELNMIPTGKIAGSKENIYLEEIQQSIFVAYFLIDSLEKVIEIQTLTD